MRWLAGILALLGLGTSYFGAEKLPVQSTTLSAEKATVELSENGLIEITAQDKHYNLTPLEVKFDAGGQTHAKDRSSLDQAKLSSVWGEGSDINVDVKPSRISKTVSFTQDFLKTIPPEAKYLEVSFILSGDWQLQDGAYSSRTQLAPEVWLEKALAWDSSEGDPNQNYTDVEFVISGNTLTKRIPVEWLNTATFPIYTDATFTFGTKALADAGPSATADVAPIGTDKAAICWQDNADAVTEGQCLVASVTGSVPTFGTVSDFVADTSGNNNGALSACGAGPDRWIVVYNEDLAADITSARVASSTGTTINGYGTPFNLNATSSSPVCVQVDTDTIVFAFGDNPGAGTSRIPKARACTIGSDYTLTCGSTVNIGGATTVGVSSDFSCARADTNKFVCKYLFGTSDFPQTLVAGTVSGTTITAGATTTITKDSGSGTDDLGHSLISPTTDKFAFYWNVGTAGQSPQYFALGSLSGTTITLGVTTTPLIATTSSFVSLGTINYTSGYMFYQQGTTDAATTFLATIPITFNWNALTFSTSTAETVDATTDPGSLHAAKIGDCKILFAWEDDNDTNDLFAKVASCASSFAPWQFQDF